MIEGLNRSSDPSAGAQDSVTVQRPQPGATLVVPSEAGLLIVLDFNPASANFAVQGDDFVLILEDGARLVFEGLVSAAQGEEAPTVQVAGVKIGADDIVGQALALTAGEETLEVAAGEEGEAEDADAGGSAQYQDTVGELIAGLVRQGIIGETDLAFELTDGGGTDVLVEAGLLSEGYLLSSAGGEPLDFEPLGALSPMGAGPAPARGVGGEPAPVPPAPLVEDSGGEAGGGGLAPLTVNAIAIVTNQATGNLQIPDELILYLADGSHGAGLSVAGPAYDGVTDNARIWEVGDPVPDSANTWANQVNDHVDFHIGNGNPDYEGSLTYQVTDQQGAAGHGTLGVKNYATAKAGSYWTLSGDDSVGGEILLGLDGRNLIDGGAGDDIIHGGHDSRGDVLIGGEGNDVIFGGSGNDDLRGGDGADTFIMRAGFGRDDVDGGANDGAESDVISLEGVLTQADSNDLAAWLSADQDYTHEEATNTITFKASAGGTVDLGGGDEIAFLDIEQIVYCDAS